MHETAGCILCRKCARFYYWKRGDFKMKILAKLVFR
jgi:hypothetical protein